ncbi:MAG: hypothetical protein P1U62_13560, partial [Alteraurantiacibacter sp. bin_em_oilr2.035]|nr:hypothetical protein [Alteraurantiacibacter sp. bin_em_oilr2.035]
MNTDATPWKLCSKICGQWRAMTDCTDFDPVIDRTALTSEAVRDVDHILWKLELANFSAMSFSEVRDPSGGLGNVLAQICASAVALVTLIWLTLRYGGSSPHTAREMLAASNVVFAMHGEDTTRTRHLRDAMKNWDLGFKPVLLLGRPLSKVPSAATALDAAQEIQDALFLRPLNLAAVVNSVGEALGLFAIGIRETACYRGVLPFRERVAVAFRMALGAAHAHWWDRAATGLPIDRALFAHTGNADSSQLEQAMQKQSIQTVHVVHGTNIGWPFAGISDVALFQSGADSRLGSLLPAYGRCAHLALERPEMSCGNGNWAVLTSYTHLQHPEFVKNGSEPDCELIRWVSEAAEVAGQNPSRIIWRPHPQI